MADPQNGDRVVLVTGATGRQGGAVARQLLRRGFRVRGLTRYPESHAARRLAELGVEVVQGDLDDAASLNSPLQGVYGVFSVQNFWETGYEREIEQGVTLADAAQAASVEHFVYTSVASAQRDTGIPHFESKWRIEEHIRGITLPYTILRPTAFMDNWEYSDLRDPILNGTLYHPLDPDVPLQQIAVDDIGAFAAMAFSDPDRWRGRELDLAGDALSMQQTVELFSRVIGRPVRYVQVPWEQFREAAGAEMTAMFEWLNEIGYDADIPALRKEYPELLTLEAYLRGHGWEGAEPPPAAD